MTDRPGAPRPFPEGMSFDQRLLHWQDTKGQLDKLKVLEAWQRQTLFTEQFQAMEGVQTFELGRGYKLKGEMPYNYNLANKEGETQALVKRWHNEGPDRSLLADRLINWKPELRVGEYRKLPEAMSQTIDSAKILTIKPGLPTLEIVAPKGAK